MNEPQAGATPEGNTLWIGNKNGEVVINHPNIKPDATGAGHIVFSPDQARGLAKLLLRHADVAEGGKQCVHCGCTAHAACVDEDGESCYWTMFERPVCSNLDCVIAENEALGNSFGSGLIATA